MRKKDNAPVTIDLGLPSTIDALRGIALRSTTIGRRKSGAAERRAATRAKNRVERETALAAFKAVAGACWTTIAAASAGDLLSLFDGKTILAFARVSELTHKTHVDRAIREEAGILIDKMRELLQQNEGELAVLVAAEGRDPHTHNRVFWWSLERLWGWRWGDDDALWGEEAQAAFVRFVDRGLRETSGATAAGSALFFPKQPRP